MHLIFQYSRGKALFQILVSRLDSISRQHKHVPKMRPVPDRNVNTMAALQMYPSQEHRWQNAPDKSGICLCYAILCLLEQNLIMLRMVMKNSINFVSSLVCGSREVCCLRTPFQINHSRASVAVRALPERERRLFGTKLKCRNQECAKC